MTDVKGEEGDYDITTEYTVLDLTPNELYKFKVRARNVHGWSSEFSNEYEFHTSTRPDTPVAALTALENLNLRIEWVAPFDNYLPISAYKIVIAD